MVGWLNRETGNRTSYSPVGAGTGAELGKIQQQTGRIGRSGERSVSITLAYSQKGKLAPEPVLRDVFKQEGCIRRKINDLFTLTDLLKYYSAVSEDVICSEMCRELEQNCDCSMCRCCSNCSSLCPCSNKDDNETLENILGFGDENYRIVKQYMTEQISSDEESDVEERSDDENDLYGESDVFIE